MDCEFIGPRTLNWWQRMLAACCSLLCLSMVTRVQKVQRLKQVRPINLKKKERVHAHHPVTVSEYVKSWLLELFNVL